jgi:hypothetical protein
MTTEATVAEVLRLERELQTAQCRGNRARVTALLAEDFTEIGASGRIWDLASTLDLLGTESEDDPVIEVRDLTGRVIGDGFVLVHWDAHRGGRRSRRASLWRRDAAGWRLVYHQGTVLPLGFSGRFCWRGRVRRIYGEAAFACRAVASRGEPDVCQKQDRHHHADADARRRGGRGMRVGSGRERTRTGPRPCGRQRRS